MSAKLTPTPEQDERRKRLTAQAIADGWTKGGLARAVGIPESTLRVWWSGRRSLAPDVERRIVAALGRAGAADAAVSEPRPPPPQQPAPRHEQPQIPAQPQTPDAVTRALETLERLAGQERASDVDLRALARSQTAAALGTLVRLMISSKSDTVKQRAAEVLIERGWGKAPKPLEAKPAKDNVEDRELMTRLEAMAKAGS